ncbi:MAG TPA: ABC transporter substrate-binding protein [Blastocatellia bacterium]|nr:ABC transporter substrate-binding protein [Blastocatellia bacterium]
MDTTRLKAGAALFLIAGGVLVALFNPPPGEAQSGRHGVSLPRLSPAEKRGKQIYLYGTSPSGAKITAFLRDAAVEVPASSLTCANCHGYRGEGKPEGGVIPSVITREFLTKPYGVTHQSGRKHPPYADRSLEVSIVRGFDPAGNRLSGAMPVYQMSREDMQDLIAYMKVLGSDVDPGVSESTLRLGTIIPGEGPAREVGIAVRAVLEAYFAEVNRQGGIYGRAIDLRVLDIKSGEPVGVLVQRFIRNDELFAMAGAFIAGSEKEVVSLVEQEEVPLIGPFTLYPRVEFPLNRHVFYLFAGLHEQALAVFNFSSEKADSARRVAVVYPQSEHFASVVPTIESKCLTLGWSAPQKLVYSHASFDPSGVATALKAFKADIVFLYTNSTETLALMNAVSGMKQTASFFLPGALAGPELLNIQRDVVASVHLSFPTLPLDQTQSGVAEYHQLAKRHALPPRHLTAQVNALGAAKVLVEALKLAGRDISREKLISTLEGFYQFQTGLTPAITYGLNRRIGALGAYVVSIDPDKKEFVPVSKWITLN